MEKNPKISLGKRKCGYFAVVVVSALALSLCGCSAVKKIEQPAEVLSVEVVGTVANTTAEQKGPLHRVRVANPEYAPNGMEPLDAKAIAELEDNLTGRLTVGSDKTGVAHAYLKSGSMVETTAVYKVKVAGGDVYVVKVFDNGAVVVMTPKEAAEQEARDAEDKAEQEAIREAEKQQRIMLSDERALKKAGVPEKCAGQLSRSFSKWCAKQKLQSIDSIAAADITVTESACTIALIAADHSSDEAVAYPVEAVWDGKKLSFTKKKEGER